MIPATLALSPCAESPGRLTCHPGHAQLTASVVEADEHAARARFVELLDWPRGRFEPVWVGDHRGWEAEVTDGERTLVARWWLEEHTLHDLTLVGPTAEVDALRPWIDRLSGRPPAGSPRPSPPRSW
ncbi:MAG: hypothetical protein H6736_10595 [Alphaproteobacteria bacterium]|nr:hypothetical protein [Alphaproteobacteria bacterium]